MKKDFLIYFNTITNLFLLTILFLGGIIWADSNGIWTDAKDIRGGTFGSDEQANTNNFTFINPVYFYNKLKSSNSAYEINISGRSQLNDLASEKLTTNLVDINGNLNVSKNIYFENITSCSGKLYTDSTGKNFMWD